MVASVLVYCTPRKAAPVARREQEKRRQRQPRQVPERGADPPHPTSSHVDAHPSSPDGGAAPLPSLQSPSIQTPWAAARPQNKARRPRPSSTARPPSWKGPAACCCRATTSTRVSSRNYRRGPARRRRRAVRLRQVDVHGELCNTVAGGVRYSKGCVCRFSKWLDEPGEGVERVVRFLGTRTQIKGVFEVICVPRRTPSRS